MAISDIATTAPAGFSRGPLCTVCNALGGLEESEANALRSLLADPKWRYQELSERLEAEGLKLAAEGLSRHARGRCLAGEKLRGNAR